MTENVIQETEQKKVFSLSEDFKKFLIVLLGTFVGVYLALSLFAVTHKPQIKPFPFHRMPAFVQMHQPCIGHHMKKHHHSMKNHHKKFRKDEFKRYQEKQFKENFIKEVSK